MEAPRKSSNGIVLHRLQEALDDAPCIAALRPAREYESNRLSVDEMEPSDWIIPLQSAQRIVVKTVFLDTETVYHIAFGNDDYWVVDAHHDTAVISVSRAKAKDIISTADDVGFITFEDSSFVECMFPPN